MSADCEINNCGVLAVGRCHDCNQAFCTTHRALATDLIHNHYTDLCSQCLKQQKTDKAAAAALQVAEKEHEEQRRVETLASLKAAGNPRLQARSVPGRYNLSIFARIFGRVGKAVLVDVEPAWPIGVCRWMHWGRGEQQNFEDLESGYTPSQRIVPMHFATKGDDVEILYAKRNLHVPFAHSYPTMVVTALERAIRG